MTPILHIGWAKPLISTIGKFDYDIRSQVIITAASDDEEIPEIGDEEELATINNVIKQEEANNNSIRASNNNNSGAADLPPTLAALTAACGEKLLNPNFLTGGEVQPFTTDTVQKQDEAVVGKPGDSSGPAEELKEVAAPEVVVVVVIEKKEDPLDDEPKRPEIKLYSHKMKGLRNLLLGEKLNTQAVLLQMTAQSQVGAGKKGSRGAASGDFSMGNASKEDGSGGGPGSGVVGGNTGSANADGEVTASGRPKRARFN